MYEHLYLIGYVVILISFSVMMYVLQHAILKKPRNVEGKKN
ncbi:hypothetical protein BH10BAC2_BH10BAC2_33180 [soil metagenome]